MRTPSEVDSLKQEIKHSVLTADTKRQLLLELENSNPSDLPQLSKKIEALTSEALDRAFEEPPKDTPVFPDVPTHVIQIDDGLGKLREVERALNDAKIQYNQFCKATSTKILENRLANADIQMGLKQKLDTLQGTRDDFFKRYQGKPEASLTGKQKEYRFNRVENFKADVRAFTTYAKNKEADYWRKMDRNFLLEKKAQEVIASALAVTHKPSLSDITLAAARNLMTRFKVASQQNRVKSSPSTDKPESPRTNRP